jgi:hypothetical protein
MADTESTVSMEPVAPTAAPQHHVASVCTDDEIDGEGDTMLSLFAKVVEMITDTPSVLATSVSWVAVFEDEREAADVMRDHLQQLQWGRRNNPKPCCFSATLYDEQHFICCFKFPGKTRAGTKSLQELLLRPTLKLLPRSTLDTTCQEKLKKLLKRALPGTAIPQVGGNNRVAKIEPEAGSDTAPYLTTLQGTEPGWSIELLDLLQYNSPAPDDETTRLKLLERARELRDMGAFGDDPLDDAKKFNPLFRDVWTQHYEEGPDMTLDIRQSVEEQEKAMAQAGKFVQLAFFNLRRRSHPPSQIRSRVQRKIEKLKKEVVDRELLKSGVVDINKKRKRTDDTAQAVAALESTEAEEGDGEPDQIPEAGYEQHVRETTELERRNGHTGYLS